MSTLIPWCLSRCW